MSFSCGEDIHSECGMLLHSVLLQCRTDILYYPLPNEWLSMNN